MIRSFLSFPPHSGFITRSVANRGASPRGIEFSPPFCSSLSSPPCSCWYGQCDDLRTVQRTDQRGNSRVSSRSHSSVFGVGFTVRRVLEEQ
ncbi:hypothetical protein OPV22_031190 [Ensete ventricosum]|uniref:Uncharacterized protein n=1 Tax=Ensete ventricosum TaxID=4639 RepID=A0AAV8PVS8_ENSVE|nr:hypothetical protein OPV22_031190 [Ensete ventricosum]